MNRKQRRAVEKTDKASKQLPDNLVVQSNLGVSLINMGRFCEAEACFRRALKLKPDFAKGHSDLAVALINQGRFVEAEASFRHALELSPDFAEGHGNLGSILRDFGRLEEAAACFRRALEIKPDFAEGYINLGHTLRDMEQLDESEVCYRRALALKPDFVEVHRFLGHTFKEMGRSGEALASYRLALKYTGEWHEAIQRLTTPLIVSTGLDLGSRHTVCHAETGRVDETPHDQDRCSSSLFASPTAHTERCASAVARPGAKEAKRPRIMLIYPPPYQIPSAGETVMGMPYGPPCDTHDRNLDGDFRTITYGLLTIAAQAKRAGYDVMVHNLAASSWRDIVELITASEADVYGISAFTANRRGMGAVAELIRAHHPSVHITVGGPFVTALPQDTLKYYRSIDTAVIGEGEETFMELLARLESGCPAIGIPGTAWREGDEVVIGPTRPRIDNLDLLASPFDYFTSHIVMTSRGCPSKCSFCGSFTTWGKKVRFLSAGATLDTIKKALSRVPVPFIAIKDDTFTAHRQRTHAICDAIAESTLNFIWSCDTRVDCLDDEMLRKMRLAGCQMICLGVESGSPAILKTMRKETTPDKVLEATRAARKYGICVRYYMILANRGETPETVLQSIDLIKTGRPNHYFFSPLTFFPGTEDWEILKNAQGLSPDIYFRNDFLELNVTINRHRDFQNILLRAQCDIGEVNGFDYTVAEREVIAERLPKLHSVHVELANAYFRAARFGEALAALNQAEDLGFPIGGIILNQRACISLAQNDLAKALAHLERASEACPHHVVMNNLKRLRKWADAPALGRGKPPVLNDSVQALDYVLPVPLSDGLVKTEARPSGRN